MEGKIGGEKGWGREIGGKEGGGTGKVKVRRGLRGCERIKLKFGDGDGPKKSRCYRVSHET